MTAARPFRIITAGGRILHGAQLPLSGRCFAEDETTGPITAATSTEALLDAYPGARIEWIGTQPDES
ncbi:hypothetical protein B4N89_13550 [Embleya scabrispora]|uniref:Uncharacterized protein n=1 Tax=Embleya scabrispora TaxID=159449 RepID=A0A1T3NYK6_9ACTN|nr:hypothetical protein [Embleya scabrispora]OPC81825.1 hypothetical protein B4N89_13550 [Embleya scabrispora]